MATSSSLPGKATVDTHIFQEFRGIVGNHGLISSPEELHTYECDGLTNFRVMPLAGVAARGYGTGAGDRTRSAIGNAFPLWRAAPAPA